MSVGGAVNDGLAGKRCARTSPLRPRHIRGVGKRRCGCLEAASMWVATAGGISSVAGTPMGRTLGLVLVAVASVGCRDRILASPAATPVAPPDSVPYGIGALGARGGLYGGGSDMSDR